MMEICKWIAFIASVSINFAHRLNLMPLSQPLNGFPNIFFVLFFYRLHIIMHIFTNRLCSLDRFFPASLQFV